MKNFSKPAVLIFAFALLFAAGCKKNNTNSALLVLNIYPYFGSDSIVPGKNYATASGDSISFNRTSFYISNLQLNNTNGTSYADSGYILVTSSGYQNIVAGSVPTGSYKSISFSVGISAAVNHIDPGNYTGGPLAAQTPSMHFSTDNLGYIFMAIEGFADSTNNHLSPNKAFSYHIGADSLLETVNLPDHSVAPYNAAFSANGSQVMTINIIADFSQLLKNVNIPANPITNTSDVPVLADTLAAHIPGMFRYLN
jgi:hypothetical protein